MPDREKSEDHELFKHVKAKWPETAYPIETLMVLENEVNGHKSPGVYAFFVGDIGVMLVEFDQEGIITVHTQNSEVVSADPSFFRKVAEMIPEAERLIEEIESLMDKDGNWMEYNHLIYDHRATLLR
ncbi:MAG: hypothetical protein AAGA97_01155 [Pseudomonadota bacterium]